MRANEGAFCCGCAVLAVTKSLDLFVAWLAADVSVGACIVALETPRLSPFSVPSQSDTVAVVRGAAYGLPFVK